MTLRTLLQITLIDGTAVIADGIGNVEREIVTSLLGSYLQKFHVLLLRQVLIEIHVQCRSTCQMLDVGCTVEFELVNHTQRLVLNDIEVGVIAVARHKVAILTVPLGMLHTNVFCRNHFTVEHDILCTVLLVILLNQSQDALNEVLIVVIWSDLQPHELSCLYQAIDTDGQILATDIDVACIKQRQHTMCLKIFQILVIRHLYLVAQVDDAAQIL